MSLWASVQTYLDPGTGLLTAGESRGTDNLILMSAYLLRELVRRQETTAACQLIERMHFFLVQCSVAPGLYRRLPNDPGDNSVDNLIGACSLWSCAYDILDRWETHHSCFDVNNPNKFALNRNFYARFIGLKSYIIAASRRKPNLLQRTLWCLSVFYSVHFSTGSSDPLLLSLQVDKMNPWCPKTCAYWRRHYSLKDLYSQYFGPIHPLSL